ncbi:MAG TPA: hypothetical protein VMC09_06530 [Anaerolineales bacterium]|nr:hypothetical protein [Anaerolineales bacterium]
MLQDIFSALTSSSSQGKAQSQAGGDALSGLLGSFMGGQAGGAAPAMGSQTGSNPLMDLVGSGQNPVLNSLIQPAVDRIAQRLGVPPQTAMTAVTYAAHYMLANHGARLANGEDISSLLQQHTSQDYLHSAGLSKELAQQTGMHPDAAANALSEVFKLLGSSSPAK